MNAEPARPPPTAILVAVTASGPLALNIFVPSMPGMVAAFDSDFATVQWTLTLYLVGVALGQLIYGPLSDRYGRRPLLLAGMTLFCLASAGAAVAGSIEWLIALRLAQALGACAGMVLTRAIVRDVHVRERAASALGYITMAMAVAPAMAPAIGAYLEVWFGWRASFVLVAVIAVAVTLASWRYLRETNPHRGGRFNLLALLRDDWRLARTPAFLGFAGATAFSSGAFFAFVGGAPYVVVHLIGGDPRDYGIHFALVSVGFMTGSFCAGRISARLGVERMVPLGIAIALAGVALLAAWTLAGTLSLLSLFAPMFLIAIGHGISQPNSIAGAVSVNPRAAGAASGLVGFGQMLVGGCFTVLVGRLLTDSVLPLVAIMACSTIAAMASYLIAQAATRRRSDP